MKKTPRPLLGLGALMLTLTAAGCGAQSDDDSITLAGVSILAGDPYFVSMKCGAQDAAAERDVELLWDGSTSADVGPQAEILSAMELKSPDGFIFTPFSQDAFVADVTEIMESGAPVVLADATMAKHVYYQGVQSDNEAAGQLVADFITEAAGDSGKVGLIAFGPGNPIDEARYAGLDEKLAKSNNDIELLKPEYGKGSSSDSAKLVSGLLQAHPDLKVIYATNGPQATGAASAIRAAGREGEIKLIAYAGEAEQIEALKAGSVSALLAQSPYLIGKKAVDVAVDYIEDHGNGEAVVPAEEQVVYTPTMLITPENVDSEEAEPFLTTSC